MKKIVIASGYFNPLHKGHIEYLEKAKTLGDFLVVIVNNNDQVRIKGSAPFMSEDERLAIVESIRFVDKVFLSIDKDTSVRESLKAVVKLYPGEYIFAKGGDRNSTNIPEKEICEALGITIVDGLGKKVQSSSWLISNIVNKFFAIKTLKNTMKTFSSIEVLGNKIDMVELPEVVEFMDYWVKNEKEKTHWIVATGMHGVMESKRNMEFAKMLKAADLWVCDGISLVWLARFNGFKLKKRVAGPDLFHEFLKFSNQKGYRHYFYGDTDETLSALKEKLSKELPDIKTESFSPPFRKLTLQEDGEIIKKINDAKPDVLWVGLGLPKQEKWILEHKEKLNVPVIVGVGAAFKFEAGTVKRAPAWIGNAGFEWLWRLFVEPKTTWKRVFIDMPIFFWLIISDLLKKKVQH